MDGSSLGLFHGASCYAEYAPWCPTSYVVHDVHAKQSDAIIDEQLAESAAKSPRRSFRISTRVGRTRSRTVRLDCRDKPASGARRRVSGDLVGRRAVLGEMRNEVVRRGFADVVSLPGFVSDREELLAKLAAHVLVFCHTTPESPRNLVEALILGCPSWDITAILRRTGDRRRRRLCNNGRCQRVSRSAGELEWQSMELDRDDPAGSEFGPSGLTTSRYFSTAAS